MITTKQIDQRAAAMSDGERDAYLTSRGWEFDGAGWFPPGETREEGLVQWHPSGMYSMSTAIREQLAREDPGTVPDEFGRHYHGQEPAGAPGARW